MTTNSCVKMDITNLCSKELITPIGKLLIVGSPRGICRIYFATDKDAWANKHGSPVLDEDIRGILSQATEQLTDYFNGRGENLNVLLDLQGTSFQLKVWRQLLKIPHGCTVSYGKIARAIGNPRASQAVGSAVGRNPVPIMVPCHRVIGCNGLLVGFRGGLPVKKKLLELEGVRVRRGSVVSYKDCNW
ncbi:MAG: methylated-DNA--[protein]-cysteine S-methyltransferase [Acidobacteriota bacterium]|nr:methylated-DNA--[protein]-cysteine S-methyltransferase [Acidobacteriota bacterium]